MKPRLLDVFCGAGGATAGYQRAGYYVVGVDIAPQPRYCGEEFVQADALEFLAGVRPGEWDLIHASPPCQAFTCARHMMGREHPNLIPAVRELLQALGTPWIIENVPGAPLVSPVILCGLALGIKVKRHRLFEVSAPILVPPCPAGHRGEWYTVFGDGGSRVSRGRRRDAKNDTARQAMGIDWMNRRELSQAIPPAYTHWVGRQMLVGT